MFDTHHVILTEAERQAALLAFAVLSLHRPGWDDLLNSLALKMDNNAGDRAELYDRFRGVNADQYKPDAERRAG